MNLSTYYAETERSGLEDLAKKAGTSGTYLWQLATGWRGKRPSVDLMTQLAKADSKLTVPELLEEFYPAKEGA